MRGGTQVTVTDAMMRLADQIAHERDAVKRRYNVRSRKFHDPAGDLEIHRQAALAELAVAQTLGGTVDTEVRPSGVHSGNVVLPDGRRAMVKYRSRQLWDLALNTDSMASFYGNVAVLVWPGEHLNLLWIVGYIERARFEERCWIDRFKSGQRRLVCGWRDMEPIDQLIGELDAALEPAQPALF